jgi:hypothetical protein
MHEAAGFLGGPRASLPCLRQANDARASSHLPESTIKPSAEVALASIRCQVQLQSRAGPDIAPSITTGRVIHRVNG